MKQRDDKYTMEIPELVEQYAPTPAKHSYMFYIITTDGNFVEWRGLSKAKALQMYRYTEQSNPVNVKSYGWEQTK